MPDLQFGEAEKTRRNRVLEYISTHGSDLSFTKFFWKNCEPNNYELRRYSEYVRVIEEHYKGTGFPEISRLTGAKIWSIRAWISFKQKPKLIHFLDLLLRIGEPRAGFVWLSLNNTSRHGIPLGPIIQVPSVLRNWEDMEFVMSQIQPGPSTILVNSRAYMLGFLLGIVIGDGAKKRQKTWHRHLELVLSKKYATSVKIGDFTCQCAQSMGLRMKRMNDTNPPGKTNGFFVWQSQSSSFIDWIFNVCIGLNDDELTTYDPVRMAWALDGPRDFRSGLVQGLAESDGSVNTSGQEVEFWIGPSWDFVKSLLETFDIRSFRNRQALAIAKSQVKRASKIPIFAPHLKTVRYQKFMKLASAKHIDHCKRLPIRVRERIVKLAQEGKSIPSISEQVLEEFGLILSYESVQRWGQVAKCRNEASTTG